MTAIRFRCPLAAACLLLSSGVLTFAQNASIVRSGSYELGGFIGSSYGIDKYRWMGGGNLTYAINRRILPYGEFSYFPGIGRQVEQLNPTGQISRSSYSVSLVDFHGGVHVRFPVRESPIVPYGVFGVGVIHTRKTTRQIQDQAGNTQFTTSLDVPASTDPAVNFGGGLRYYANQKFGIRAEAKVYRPTRNWTNYFGKVEVGFFYQFK